MMVHQATARARAPIAVAAAARLRAMVILGMAAILALVISGFTSVAFAAGSDSGSDSGGEYKSYGVSAEMRKAIALVKPW